MNVNEFVAIPGHTPDSLPAAGHPHNRFGHNGLPAQPSFGRAAAGTDK